MKMKKRNKLFVILSVIIFLLATLIWVPRLFGMNTYYVSSDSMEPAISKGSLVFTEQVEPHDIRVGEDVLVFTSPVNGKTFMHRVIYINETEQLIYTKGDNNNVADPVPAGFTDCSGRVVFDIPLVGYAAWAIDTVIGKIAVIAFYIVCVAVMLESHRAKKSKKEVES